MRLVKSRWDDPFPRTGCSLRCPRKIAPGRWTRLEIALWTAAQFCGRSISSVIHSK